MNEQDIREQFDKLIAKVDRRSDASSDFNQTGSDRGSMLAACVVAHALVSQLSPGDRSFLPVLEEMIKLAPRGSTTPSQCCELFVAMADHFGGGFHKMRELVEADIFTDLVDMASYLLDQSHHLPAAAITGAVLEDNLRKLCLKHNVQWANHSSIDKLNTELYKANVYDNPQRAQIAAWGSLRNKVDHHNFTDPADIDPHDVKRMIGGVQDFIVKYLT